MGEIEGTTLNLYCGRWSFMVNWAMGRHWCEWQRTDCLIFGVSVETPSDRRKWYEAS